MLLNSRPRSRFKDSEQEPEYTVELWHRKCWLLYLVLGHRPLLDIRISVKLISKRLLSDTNQMRLSLMYGGWQQVCVHFKNWYLNIHQSNYTSDPRVALDGCSPCNLLESFT